jgi:hypothetical protein
MRSDHSIWLYQANPNAFLLHLRRKLKGDARNKSECHIIDCVTCEVGSDGRSLTRIGCSRTLRGRRREWWAIGASERIVRAPTPFVVVDRAHDQSATIGTEQHEHRRIGRLARCGAVADSIGMLVVAVPNEGQPQAAMRARGGTLAEFATDPSGRAGPGDRGLVLCLRRVDGH